MSRRKRWVIQGVFLLLGILMPLFMLELGFRVFGPFLPGDYNLGIEREFDAVLGWRHRANFAGGTRTSEFNVRSTTNSMGLYDEEIPYAKPPGTYRILGLGDSFMVVGEPPARTMVKQLQSKLQTTLAPMGVQALNAGVSGYGTAQQYLYLDTEGYKYRPDLVLVVVFLGNDLIDNVRDSDGRWDRPMFDVDSEFRLEQTEWPKPPRVRTPAWQELVLRNSTLGNFVSSGVLEKLRQPADSGETGRDPKQDFQIYERRPTQKLRRAWEVTEALLAAVAARAETMGARTLVIGAPSFRQLDPVRFNQLVQEEGLDPDDYDLELPSRLLQESTSRRRLPYLDVLPALRQATAAGEGDVFLPRNTHWAPAGHRVVAQAIHDYLVSNPELLRRAGTE